MILSYDRRRLDTGEAEEKKLSDFWKNIIWAIVLITLLAIIL